jgi:hypothetical protein
MNFKQYATRCLSATGPSSSPPLLDSLGADELLNANIGDIRRTEDGGVS